MKRITVNLDDISDFDLKLAKNPDIPPLLEEIVQLPFEERQRRLNALREKIRQGGATLFEEHVQVKLLAPRKAEWVRVVHKNLAVIEKQLQERALPRASAELKKPDVVLNLHDSADKTPARRSRADTKPTNRRRAGREEYHSELLDFISTQKPPAAPVSSKRGRQAALYAQDQRKNVHVWSFKDGLIGLFLIAGLFLSVWSARSFEREDVNAPLSTFDNPNPQQSFAAESETSDPRYQEFQAQYDAAAHTLRFDDFAQGEAELLELIDSAPETSFVGDAYLMLADTYRQRQKNPDQAIAYYQRFLTNFPEERRVGLVLLKMGYAYEDLQDLENAQDVYRRLVAQRGAKSRLGQLAQDRLQYLSDGRETSD